MYFDSIFFKSFIQMWGGVSRRESYDILVEYIMQGGLRFKLKNKCMHDNFVCCESQFLLNEHIKANRQQVFIQTCNILIDLIYFQFTYHFTIFSIIFSFSFL